MTSADEVPNLTLHDGVEMPQLGFGVFQIPPEETQEKVEEALSVGYRHVDTAAIYGNEEGVGAAVAATGVRREDVFVTTKLWNSEQGYDSTLRAFEASLERLGTGHVDLYLIHWPMPSRDLYLDTWRAFERIKEEGGARWPRAIFSTTGRSKPSPPTITSPQPRRSSAGICRSTMSSSRNPRIQSGSARTSNSSTSS